MSMLGVTMLNDIINKQKIVQTDTILNELRNQIKIALGQTGNTGEQKDGMDISICLINMENLQLQYSGAFHSLYILQNINKNSDYTFQEIKGDHMPIGVHPIDYLPFTISRIQLNKNDRIYLFSDGFVSQFGGEHNQKFKSKRFQELIMKIQGTALNKQKMLLDKALNDWQGNAQQVDDILVIGLQV